MDSSSISEKYKKMSQREHLLQRPGMYMGSIYNTLEEVWVLENEKMVKKNIMYNPGILKLFDEIIMNSADHAREHPDAVTTIRITVDQNKISIFNDGPGIPIVKHSEHDMYIPELLFSQFLTSTNYNDNEERLKAGLNGLGAKITSAFSKLFQVETVSGGKIYIQNFSENLKVIEEPIIKKCSKKEYTKITFFPDLKKFKVNKISDATYKMLEKRAYDVAACTSKKVSVFFNEKKLNVKDFREYIDLFIPDEMKKEKVVIENERWKVAICTSPFDEFTQVSFVNGVSTMNGGTHVNYIVNPVIKKIIEKYQKKVKETTIKNSFLRDNMMVFVFSLIVNPEFKSQAKEELTTKSANFGSHCIVDDVTLKKIEKMDMIRKMMEYIQFKENKALSASDGKKKLKLTGIPKLDDANSAGGKMSSKCTLILTEGDSAKTFAISGLKPKDRDFYGIYPLRGKFLNVRDATTKQILNNQEIKNLKTILGLQNGKKFENLEELKKTMRYGKILILTDQDVDGSHIKGLLINFFHHFWPILVTDDRFITCLQTPIVKANKGKTTKVFYNIPEYKKWKKTHPNWKVKYYKGLGTSSASEAKECFENLEEKKIFYQANKREDQDSIRLAFQKNMSNNRKSWIQENCGKEIFIDNTLKEIPIKRFIDEELVHFSIGDCERSIPSIVDGLKPSQRKVLYGTMKKNTKDEMKVDQLRGFISEKTAYHHGDTSLNETIISMNHDYVGSNNINLLLPCGQLGTRLMGGKDAASPRYISTKINPITMEIFKESDSKLLNYLNDDGYPIEPEFFVPCIPMILVNGTSGIGTGYATNIPCFNPMDIIERIEGLLNDDFYSIKELTPWYRNFKGSIQKKDNGWSSFGVWKRVDRSTIDITELPIGTWTDNYSEHLDKLLENPELNINDIKNFKTDKTVHYQIKAPSLQIDEWIREDQIEKIFKLKGSLNANFTLFDEKGKIRQFDSAEEILYHFFTIRETYYKKRRKFLIDSLADDIKETSAKVLFIQRIISGEIEVFRVPKNRIVEQLHAQDFPLMEDSYDYLLNLKVYNFTEEQIEKLENEKNKLEKQLDEINTKTFKDLWLEDLEILKNALASL